MFKTLLIATTLLVSAATAATAAPAWTTGSVNFRDGAGTYYAKLGTIARCVRVETDYVQNGWYRVSWNGRWGWVSARYLAWNGNYCSGGGYSAPRAHSAPSYNAPSYNAPSGGGY